MTPAPHPKPRAKAKGRTATRLLLGCPFCGDAPEFKRLRSSSHQYPHAWAIRCTPCQCERFVMGITEAAAIDAVAKEWNERATSRKRTRVQVHVPADEQDYDL